MPECIALLPTLRLVYRTVTLAAKVIVITKSILYGQILRFEKFVRNPGMEKLNTLLILNQFPSSMILSFLDGKFDDKILLFILLKAIKCGDKTREELTMFLSLTYLSIPRTHFFP